jgi:DNA polymerase III alpha subunit
LGLYKYDILSQRGLGHIKDSVELVKSNQGRDIDINGFSEFKKDKKINEILKVGKTTGCFYVESPAMRMLLTKLKCEDYPTLVAASSIIRPGVASSGMMQEYIYRHHNPNNFTYIHPKNGGVDERNLRSDGISRRCNQGCPSFCRSHPCRC